MGMETKEFRRIFLNYDTIAVIHPALSFLTDQLTLWNTHSLVFTRNNM